MDKAWFPPGFVEYYCKFELTSSTFFDLSVYIKGYESFKYLVSPLKKKILKAHSQVSGNFWPLKVLKMMKNACNFALKAIFVLKTFFFS